MDESEYERPSRNRVYAFRALLEAAGERVRDLAVAPSRDVRVRLAVRGQTQAPIHAALLEFQAMTVFGSAGAALLRARALHARAQYGAVGTVDAAEFSLIQRLLY